jgi:hypothetical protein
MRLLPSLFSIIYLIFFASLAQAKQANDILVITPNSSNIIIDGDLSDWRHISFTQNFVLHDKNKLSTQKTRAKVTRDNKNLYFAFEVQDKNIVGTNQPHDAKLFTTDDLIEVFIDADADGENYLEFGVNAYGNIYDYVLNCVKESCGGWSDNPDFTLNNIVVKTSVQGTINNNNDIDTGFIVEIKLPFKALKLIKQGNFTKPAHHSEWRVNMFRIDYGIDPIEYQSWRPHHSFGLHQPDKFGYFYFKDY